jgi:hypothetical protein
MLGVIRLAAGAVLLLLGKRVYWLLVGLLGFAAGLAVGASLFEDQSGLLVLLAGLVGGIVGAILAVIVQKIALTVGGFFAGGYAAVALWELLVGQPAPFGILPFLIGGILGAALTLVLFDWALIVLSSLVGASMIVQTLDPSRPISFLLLVALIVLGIVVQASSRERAPSPPPPLSGAE